MPELQLQQRQPAQASGAGDPSVQALGSEQRAAMIQCVGELGRGLRVLDAELRTRQLAAARDSLRAMAILVEILDGLLPVVLGGVYLCRCGRVREPASAVCWRCG